jgi:hypothetical protein
MLIIETANLEVKKIRGLHLYHYLLSSCSQKVDLSRFSAVPGAHLSGDSFKSQGAFPA